MGTSTCATLEALRAIGREASVIVAHRSGCPICGGLEATLAAAGDASGDLATLPSVDASSYAIGREIARGGMGRISTARDRRIGRDVAVKELLVDDEGLAVRFEREARITARLQHPNIVPIYEIGTWPDGTPFYAMRMVDGHTLGTALSTRTELARRLELLPSLIAAAEAIAFAHARDVIHRDLTPANILVGDFGETVVIDWGLAKDLSRDDDEVDVRVESTSETLTAIGAVIGTAAYMPPEQARGEPADRRGDVYALGALLYRLLTGEAPYRAATSLEIVELVKAGPPVAIDRRVAHAPRDLVSIAQKAMARSPDDRYPTARELAQELVRFQNGRVVEAHAYSRAERLRRWIGAHRVAVAVAAALVVAGSIGLAGIVRERAAAVENAREARSIAVALLEEQGRQELLRGDNDKALAYLDAALQQGLDTPVLRFMLAQALRDVEAHHDNLACGGAVSAIEMSERTVAAACGDETRIWVDGALQHTLATKGVRTLAFSRDGRSLIAIGEAVLVWDVASGAQRTRIAGARFAAFTADAGRVVTVAANGATELWDATSGALVRELRPGANDTNEYRARVRGDILVEMDTFGRGEIWRLDGMTRTAAIELGAPRSDLAISLDGTLAMSCGDKGRARIWNTSTGALVRAIDAHVDTVTACDFVGDGVLVASADGAADLWRLDTGEKRAALQATEGIYAIAASSDGARIATAGLHAVDLWTAATGEHLARFSRSTEHLVFDRTDLLIASGARIERWDARGAIQRTALAPSAGMHSFQPSNDGSRDLLIGDVVLLYASKRIPLQLWDTIGKRAIPHAPVYALSSMFSASAFEGADFLSADGTRLVAATSETELAVIDGASGKTLSTIPISSPENMTLDANGHRVLIVDKGAPRVWDTDQGRDVLRLDHHDRAWSLSADGRRVLAWRDATHVEVWDVDAQRIVSMFEVVAPTTALGFSADATRVAVIEDAGLFGAGRLGLWDADTGARLLSISTNFAQYDPSLRLLSSYDDGKISIWRTSDGARVSAAQMAPSDDGRLGPMPQATADGAFVATIGEGNEAIDIRSAIDGRILARLGVAHLIHARYLDGSLLNLGYPARWAPRGMSVASFGNAMSLWDLAVEPRSSADIHAVVASRVAWRVQDGALIAVTSQLRGHAAPGSVVTARLMPLGSSSTTTATPAGVYAFDALPPGVYAVGTGTLASRTVNVDLGVTELDL